MIVQCYIPLSISDNNVFSDNGLNLEIDRCEDDTECSVKLVDDGGKQLLYFSVEFKDLKKVIQKLEYQE